MDTTTSDARGQAPSGSLEGPVPHGLAEAALRASNDVVYVLRVEPDLAFEYIGDSVEGQLGYRPQEFYDDATLLLSLVRPEERSQVVAALAAPVGVDVTVEVAWLHRDGHVVWAEHRGRKRARADGSVVMEGSARDSTALHQAQEALAATARELRALTDNITDVVARIRRDHTIEYISPSVTASLGWAPSEVVGRRYDEFWHPEDLAATIEAQRAGRSGDRVRVRARARTRGGDWRWMEIVGRAVTGQGGESLGVTVARDVDEQVRAEQALAEAAEQFRVIEENIADVIIRTRPDLTIDYVSPSMTALSGWRPEELVGHSNVDLFHPDDLPVMAAAAQQAIAGDPIRFRARAQHKDGSYRWVDVAGRAVLAADGTPLVGVTVARDVDEQVRAEQALADSEQRFRLLAENASDIVLLIRADGVLEWVSPSIRPALGWDAANVIGTMPWELVHPDDRDDAIRALVEATRTGVTDADVRVRLRHRDGLYRWMAASAHLLPADGELSGVVVGLHDVTDQVAADQARATSEERFRLAMLEAPQGMAILDRDGAFAEVNPALSRMLGRDAQWLLTHHLDEVLHPDEVAADQAARRDLLVGAHRYTTAERRYVRGDGRVVWVQHAIGLLRGADGDPTSYVAQFHDITSTRVAAQALAYQAAHDRLTGLLNREELTTRLQRALSGRSRTGTRLGVLFCDLDNLKSINDAYGHAAGDTALVAVSAALTTATRASDTIARVGGDEFVVLLTGIHDLADAQRVATAIHHAARQPVPHGDIDLHPTLSIGITLADAGQDADTVLSRADSAMYAAKNAGRNRIAVAASDGIRISDAPAGDQCGTEVLDVP